jgi:transposase-like protein
LFSGLKVGRSKPETLKYAQKKNLCKCLKCGKYKAIKKGKRRDKERFECLACGARFEKGNDKPNEKITGLEVLADHLDRASYRMLSRKHGLSRTKLCKIVNDELKCLPTNYELTERLIDKLKYSGRLIVDGKYVPIKEKTSINLPPKIVSWAGKRNKIPRSKKRQKVRHGKTLIWGCDYASHDIPHQELGDGENGFVMNDYFRKLKELKYPLVSLTVDDKEEIPRAAKRHYPEVIIQLCIRHYGRKIGRELGTGSIKIRIRALEKRLDELFVEGSEYIPTSRSWSRKKAVHLINEILELSFRHELILDFEKIILSIISAKDYGTAENEMDYLLRIFWPRVFRKMRGQFEIGQIKKVGQLIADFKDKKEYLTSYLKYPHLGIPRTNNMIEGYNSQLELRLASIRGFETIESAKNYLNAWTIKRRLTPFTDCRKEFRKLNGRSPLECSGVDSSTIEKLSINGLIRQKKRGK